MDKSRFESSDSLYINQLEYSEKDGKSWINFFIRNIRVTLLLAFSMLVWGLISLAQLPLESQPEVEIPFGAVAVSLPGASPSDVEELIVTKLESEIANIQGVKQISSVAFNSLASISVEFQASEDLQESIRRLRDVVDNVKAELPEDASDPFVNEVSFSNTPVWTLVVTGPYDSFTLRTYAELVQDELEALPGTSDVLISGGDIYEIRVSYNPDALQVYGLSVDQVNNVIRSNNFSLPLGTLDVSNFEYSVRAEGEFTNAAELRRLPLSYSNGNIVRLEDVAVVVERARERNSTTKFSLEGQEPQNAITLNIVKKTGSSIIGLIDDGKERINALKQDGLPADVNVETTLDFSQFIRDDVRQLTRDGMITIIFVTLILLIFVGLKEAFVAGIMVIPLTFACAFGLMLTFGITLNFLSLFSLILSLGILVDDAIVVVQAAKEYLKSGKFTPEEALLLVFRDYKWLLVVTTLTTIWAFLPLLLATGIIGQFIRSIPITVSATLFSSTVIAILINHPMMVLLERFRPTRNTFRLIVVGLILFILAVAASLAQGGGIVSIIVLALSVIVLLGLLLQYRRSLKQKLLHNEQLLLEEKADPEKIKEKVRVRYSKNGSKGLFTRLTTGVIKLEKILPFYGRLLGSLLQSKLKSFMVLGLVVLLFLGAVSLPATGILKAEFLSPADSEYLYINVTGAPGLLSDKVKTVTDQVQEVLLQEETIRSFSLVLGASGVNLNDGGATGGGGGSRGGQTNRAQFAINFYPIDQRPPSGPENRIQKSYEIAPRIREKVEGFQGATVEVVEISDGPPTGSDIEARIVGEDLDVLEAQANKYKDILAEIPGTVNETTSITLSPGEFTFVLKPDAVAAAGISSVQVASTLRTALSSTEVTKILRDGEEVLVQAEFNEDQIPSIDALRNLLLVNSRGQTFRLGDIADVELGPAVTSISRIDQKRVLLVSAAVEQPFLPPEVLVQFQEKIAQDPPPPGYEISFGGQNETNEESVLSILRAMLLAMILIIGTLVIQYNSFRKAALVLATIPLAITGVFYGLTLINFTLSFPALIGVLALFGIVVKNAVILVDKINLNLKVGIPFVEAIVDASKSRLEAIYLTSIGTIIGMIPITLNNETWEGLGATLIFGLSSSTFLTLFVIPILFNLLLKKKHQKEVAVEDLKNKVLLRGHFDHGVSK